MPLTDIACKNAACPPDRQRLRLSDSAGLYLEVLPAGGKYWRLKYRFSGKEKKLALGVYPRVSLKEARLARDAARATLAHGTDPGERRRVAKAEKRLAADRTFESVARSWWAQWSHTKTAKHADQVLRRLEADVFPAIGAAAIDSLTAAQLLGVALKIEKRGAIDIAKRAFQTCSMVLRYAVAHGLIDRNPAADVKPSDVLRPTRKENYARLDAREVPELLRRIDAYDGSPYTRCALRLMALTFVRTSELIGARWDEFDLVARQWRIPAERMKMKTPHVVPLSRQALAVLADLQAIRTPSALLFPGERSHVRPMSNNTILFALYRMGYHSRMTGHGFRGIASTLLHELGHRHDLIELQLAHQERNATSAAYNWATYLPARAEMMQAWADHLDTLRASAEEAPRQAA